MRKTIFGSFILLSWLLTVPVAAQQNEPAPRLTFPFSEYVIRSDWAMPIVWKYRPFDDVVENENIIAPPAFGADWDKWYTRMKAYQIYLRNNLNDTASLYLQMSVAKGKPVRLHFKRVLNDMRLRPGDTIIFDGFAKSNHGGDHFRISLIYIKIGQQLSHAIAKTENVAATVIDTGCTSLHNAFTLPAFDTANLMVQPVVFFEGDSDNVSALQIKGLTFSVPSSPLNQQVYDGLRPSFYPASKAVDRQLYDRKEMKWVKQNFISGFAYLWDADFWDANKKVFTVQHYCDKMKAAYGGFQSVLVWYSYPNIGIDDRNTWEFLSAIPGGINGLKDMVKTFHANGVKVYFPYTPWEIDTRKTNRLTDPQNWSAIIQQIDADGLFFDTFFDGGDFQKELDKAKKGISIGTEHHPSLQNIQGYNGITTSWGQTIEPYNNNGISRVKWLIPEHIQWKINRNEKDRQNSMAYSWINAQGILVWENVFGYMNTWNAKDRLDLRKMNALYQQFGHLYTSDTWKPYLPTENAAVHLSSWEKDGMKIWNLVTDSVGAVAEVTIPVSDRSMNYYDLWSGAKLTLTNGKVTVPIERFGCVLGNKKPLSSTMLTLLSKQKSETTAALPLADAHTKTLSAKQSKAPPVTVSGALKPSADWLPVKGGEYSLTAKNFRREGNDYPNEDAKSNDTYVIEKNSFGKEMIVHHEKTTMVDFQIMPRVVTNGEYEVFIKATRYHPSDTVNYLSHWKGSACPDSIRQKPVVYVSLEDARAYAAWAGMRLPTEWEWQLAGEVHGSKFIFKEVWEWNESERFDGHNHFVDLRGGCAGWVLQTSDWYFPGTPNNKKPGGPQPLDSHCKYYILKAGYDRAGTIGFRCMKENAK